ncbi:MAG: hypothetical protein ACRDZ0_13870 [Acidimicrobiales bacterium]
MLLCRHRHKHDLDHNIDLIERLDHVATRRLERGAERSLGIELGL